MIPIGTTVIVTSIEYDGPLRHPARLLGRPGTVTDHADDGLNLIAGLGRAERIAGYWAFADKHLTVN